MATSLTQTPKELVARNWAISTLDQSKGLYRLALVDITKPLSYGNTPVQEYVFNISPKSMDMEEPAAVVITPTQNGGHFIEHQGQIYKTINISGTTGLRPNKKAESIIPVLAIPNPFSRPDLGANGLPIGESSGFEDLLDLRNLFRSYFDFKSDAASAHKIVMVWQNGKEGEYYIVEPLNFRTRRDSSSPICYMYEIQLKTISKLDAKIFAVQKQTDTVKNRNIVNRFNERLVDIARQLGNAVRFLRAVQDRTISVITATGTSVAAVGNATTDLLRSPKEIIDNTERLFNAVKDSAATGYDSFKLPRTAVFTLLNSILDLIKTIQGVDTDYAAGKLSVSAEFVNNLKIAARQCARIYKEDLFFLPPVATKFQTKTNAYNNVVGSYPSTGGSAAALNNTSIPNGTDITIIKTDDTIYTLAARLLGDSSRWKELVIVNNLIAPYVDVSGDGNSVLRPGDYIAFPVVQTVASSNNIRFLQGDDILTKRLGRDLKVASVGSVGGLFGFDLVIGQGGDLETVEGVDNLKQAVLIKFFTEKGSLPSHPNFGAAVPIGSKVTINSMIAWNLDIRATILSDSRISEITSFGFSAEGDTLKIKADLQITGTDQNVSVGLGIV